MPFNLTLFDSKICASNQDLLPLVDYLKSHSKVHAKAVLITDSNIYPLHGEALLQIVRKAGISIEPIILPPGETFKNLDSAEECWTKMHLLGLDRTSLVIGLGGGVITDLSGYVASCYMRGISHVLIPTTLMGMVDASIGGKTAVNLPNGKNLVGTFYQPKLIVINSYYLESLPSRELHSGLSEVIKSAVIWDEPFFKYLEKNLKKIVQSGPSEMGPLIEKTALIKIQIVQQDEKEHGARAFLNWGHTFAHALETITHYQKYLHGEAVAIGICCGAQVSKELGLVDESFIKRQERLCIEANLPTKLPQGLDLDKLIDLMAGDKKAVSGKINLILARKIGQVEKVNDVDRNTIKKALLVL